MVDVLLLHGSLSLNIMPCSHTVSIWVFYSAVYPLRLGKTISSHCSVVGRFKSAHRYGTIRWLALIAGARGDEQVALNKFLKGLRICRVLLW